MMKYQLVLIVALAFPAMCAGRPMPVRSGMVRIPAGSYRPLYASPGKPVVSVPSFWMDSVPASVKSNASKALTGITFRQAAAYCEARGKRLPTTMEWEYVAQASETRRDAGRTASFRQRALELAIAFNPTRYKVGSGLRNLWGVRDMHGGFAEWTADFNGSTHAHNVGHHTPTMTCASGTVETGDASDYAAFMRYSVRRTLNVNDAPTNVGFRCVI